MYPKIELHVHLEATVRPQTLLEIARGWFAWPAKVPQDRRRGTISGLVAVEGVVENGSTL
jgi:cytochrome oxidase assembly protein ShyY1